MDPGLYQIPDSGHSLRPTRTPKPGSEPGRIWPDGPEVPSYPSVSSGPAVVPARHGGAFGGACLPRPRMIMKGKRPPTKAALPVRLRFGALRKLEPFVGNAKPYLPVERIDRLLGELQRLLGLLPVSRGVFGHGGGVTVHRSVRLSATPVCRRSAWGPADHSRRIAKRVAACPWSASASLACDIAGRLAAGIERETCPQLSGFRSQKILN